MEQCPFCKNKNVKYERNIVSPINKKKNYLHTCSRCYLSFFTPLKFENVYSEGNMYEKRHQTIKIPPWTRHMVNQLSNKKINLKNKKILDIGASNCVNFVALQKTHQINSNQYYALELDKKALKVGKKQGVKNIIPHYFNKNILKK